MAPTCPDRRRWLAGIALLPAAWSVLPRSWAAAPDAAAAHRAQLCSPANPTGVGLRGEYFSGVNLSGSVLLTRVDSQVDLDATLDWPAAQAGRRPRSVRWSGWIKAPFAGRYRFDVEPAGATLVVGPERLQGPGVTPGVAIDLEPGRFYPIELVVPRLPPSDGVERVALRWTAPHGARYVIPRNLLFLPTDRVKPARP